MPVLRAAIVLAERHQDAAALALALAAVALEALDLDQGAVEVGARLLDLVVERAALRGLAAEQREEAAALAAQPLRLLAQAVKFGLLLGRGILEALDLLGLGGIDRGAAVEGGELAFEPQAGLVAPARIGFGALGAGASGTELWRGERKPELRRRRRGPENETGSERPLVRKNVAIAVLFMERSPTRRSQWTMEAPEW